MVFWKFLAMENTSCNMTESLHHHSNQPPTHVVMPKSPALENSPAFCRCAVLSSSAVRQCQQGTPWLCLRCKSTMEAQLEHCIFNATERTRSSFIAELFYCPRLLKRPATIVDTTTDVRHFQLLARNLTRGRWRCMIASFALEMQQLTWAIFTADFLWHSVNTVTTQSRDGDVRIQKSGTTQKRGGSDVAGRFQYVFGVEKQSKMHLWITKQDCQTNDQNPLVPC